jgi:hypothetical protein
MYSKALCALMEPTHINKSCSFVLAINQRNPFDPAARDLYAIRCDSRIILHKILPTKLFFMTMEVTGEQYDKRWRTYLNLWMSHS